MNMNHHKPVVLSLLAHPDEVAGRRTLDLAAGSGLCGLVALRQWPR